MDIKTQIIMMYVTLFPAIVAGVINSIFCKTKMLSVLNFPMDYGKNFIDSKRIFGDHKTWKGFFGYTVFNLIMQVIWGVICNFTNINNLNFFYVNYENILLNNVVFGLLIGLFYALFELPNSFLKRRLGIGRGKPAPILDQLDFLIVALLFASLVVNFSLEFIIIAIVF